MSIFWVYIFTFSVILENDIDAIKQSIKGVLVQNQVALKEAFRFSLSSISDQLLQAGIITQDIHRSPSYDDIIGSFLAGITFIDSLDEVKGQCDKFLSALSNVGGPVAFAVNMLRREWEQEFELTVKRMKMTHT